MVSYEHFWFRFISLFWRSKAKWTFQGSVSLQVCPLVDMTFFSGASLSSPPVPLIPHPAPEEKESDTERTLYVLLRWLSLEAVWASQLARKIPTFYTSERKCSHLQTRCGNTVDGKRVLKDAVTPSIRYVIKTE